MTALGGAALAAGGAAGVLAWKRRTTPEEKERKRRLLLSAHGRIAEGSLMQQVQVQVDGQDRRLLLYQYSVARVTYNAAQDISSLHASVPVPLDGACEGLPARVKYDPRNPSNSIVVCETWSGL